MSLGIKEDQIMPRKRHTPEEIVAKLRQVDVLVSQGVPVADAVPQIGVTEVTYYLYVRLSHCKSILKRSAWPVANIYPASPG
jgi:putative transposase